MSAVHVWLVVMLADTDTCGFGVIVADEPGGVLEFEIEPRDGGVEVRLEDGRQVEAVTYIVDREHRQYCQLSLEEQASRIVHAVGGRGPNDAYLFNTAEHLDDLGIADEELSWLARRVRALKGETQ